MGFLGSTVIVVAMGVVATCIGALGFMLLRLSLDVAAILAMAAFIIMVLVQFLNWRRKDREQNQRSMGEMVVALEALTRDVAVLTNRVTAIEQTGIAGAMRDISGLRADLTRLNAGFDEVTLALDEQAGMLESLSSRTVAPVALASEASRSPAEALSARRGRFAHMGEAEFVAMVAQCIEAGRVEVMLQPIVTLPQRKVRWYEVVSRVRTERGETLLPEDFVPAVELGGMSARFDNIVVFRAVQLLRRLQARNRDTGVIVSLLPGSLGEGDRFRELTDFLSANTSLAAALVIQVGQGGYNTFGPIEFEGLSAISRLGFRLSLDNVRDLRADPKQLAERSFRFLKVPAEVILGQSGALPTDIHPADMAHLFSRYGIEIVADKVEAESTVVDLLDFDIRFAQGLLFSPPRPVRSEIAQETAIAAGPVSSSPQAVAS